MEKDRDQMTPADPDDAEHLRNHRGRGTGGSGIDALPGEHNDAAGEKPAAETEPPAAPR